MRESDNDIKAIAQVRAGKEWDPMTDVGHRNTCPQMYVAPPSKPHKAPLGPDMVVLPKHYSRFEIEPFHFLAANKANGFQFNIVKYTMRCEHKHDDKGQQDLRKAIRCAIMYAKFLLGDPDWWKAYTSNIAAELEKELSYAPQV